MNYGTLVRWFEDRNYGFIRDDETRKDVFVHISGFKNKLALPKGIRVQYTIGIRGDKPVALDVEPIVAAQLATPNSGVRHDDTK